MIRITSDYSDVFSELDRLEAMPTPKMVAGLETVLEIGLQSTRAKVHIDTGALSQSGKSKSKTTTNQWSGAFSFGAPEKGVDYAIYEKARGGHHDFMNGVHVLRALFKAAILKGLRRK